MQVYTGRGAAFIWRQAQTAPEAAAGTTAPRLRWQLYTPHGCRGFVFGAPRGSAGAGSYSVAVTEAASAADALVAAASFVLAVSEAATASDAVAAVMTRVAAMSEALSAADAITVTAVYGVAATEAGTASDAPTSTMVRAGAVSEAASSSDATNWGGAVYALDVAETATLADAVSTALQLLAAMAEAGSAEDTPTVVLSAGAIVAEVASALDALTGSNPTAYSVAVTEAGSALDAIVATLAPSGVVVLSAPPSGRRLQGSVRTNLQAARRPTYRGGTR